MSKIRILQMSPYFEPEQISSTHLTADLFSEWARNDITVEDYVPTPCRGISKEVRDKYKKIKFEKKYDGHYLVHRFSMFPEGHNPIIRAARYILVNILQYFKGSHAQNIDLIYAASTPPTQGVLCGLVKKRLKVPFVYNLQDIFPDSLVNANMTKKGSFIWKIGRKLENFTYSNADRIIVISESFKKNIMAKGVPEEKIDVVSNWIDLEDVNPVERKDNKLFEEFAIDPNKFIVVYAGNFGVVQGAEIVLQTAEKLQDYEDIQFVIFGGGPLFPQAVDKSKKLKNVFIHELLPLNRVSEVYSMGNVALITCRKGTGGAGLPSKLWSIMACNTYIIASFDQDSDLSGILLDSNAGTTVEPENLNALKHEIIRLHGLWKNNRLKNTSSREYVQQHASRKICTNQYTKIIQRVAEGNRGL